MSDCISLRDELLNEPAPPLLRENEGNAFRDVWEAKAFAMGNLLIKSGFISQKEWVDIFSEEILAAQAQGDPDRGNTYYNHWMNALERIVIERNVVDLTTLQENQALWDLAIRNTPHGVALSLENAYLEQHGDHGDDHDHGHHHDHDHDHDHDHGQYPDPFKPVGVSMLGTE
jgi:nitrile hydratase accessory protein